MAQELFGKVQDCEIGRRADNNQIVVRIDKDTLDQQK